MLNFKIGQEITLKWTGAKGVPMYRNYDKAIILEFKNKRMVVETNGVIYKILPEQTLEHFKANNFWINKDKNEGGK